MLAIKPNSSNVSVQMNSNLNEQYFDRVYQDLSTEHLKLLSDLKNGMGDEKANQRQIAMLSSLQAALLKLRNYRKVLAEKRD